MSSTAEANSIALVTGGSSGIGLELARCFARDGYGLIIASSNRAKLTHAAEELEASGAPYVDIVVADLAQPNGPEQLYRAVRDMDAKPDFLVCNAGSGVHGDFVRETDLNAELATIQLNVVSTVHLTKLFARDMVERGSGRILITSSIAALAPSPKLSVYSATKAFDYAFAEALSNELKDTGVTVTALLPNQTDTGFFERAGMEDTEIGRSKKSDPAEVAKAGYAAMMKGKDHVAAPFATKVTAALTSVLPASVVSAQARAD
jgi:short-subunit dehydrogenase